MDVEILFEGILHDRVLSLKWVSDCYYILDIPASDLNISDQKDVFLNIWLRIMKTAREQGLDNFLRQKSEFLMHEERY